MTLKHNNGETESMISVATRIPLPYAATSFYRSTGPFQHLRSKMNIQFVEPPSYNWMTIGMVDILFLERPHTKYDLSLIHFAKSINRKVWIDYDDNLFAVPPWNPSHRQYSTDECRMTMIDCIRSADVVSVTTEALAKSLSHLNSCIVIPNAFPNHLIDMSLPLPNRTKTVTWRGSNTHVRDLLIAVDGIKEAMKFYPDWKFIFLGEPPYDIIEEFENKITIIPLQEPISYLKSLFNLAPSIHIVPLVDDEFNRCKSNIAYLEATYAGAKVIAPGWDEWTKSWIYREGEFKDTLLTMMEHEKGLGAPDEREDLKKNLTLDSVNILRKNLIESLV